MTNGDRLHFVGTATTVMSLGSFTLLTDPNFLHRGQRAYLGWGLSSRRLTDPAIEPEALPALDAVLLSHLHGDHFDRVSRARLDRSTPVLSTPHAVRRLGSWGFDARALETWDQHVLDKGAEQLRVTAVPAVHAGAAAHGHHGRADGRRLRGALTPEGRRPGAPRRLHRLPVAARRLRRTGPIRGSRCGAALP
ncbi:MBL fold metallo-hydrolase [Nocardioides pinisoli]|uniref:MBL fold metallo-hydrolase n=1 Tax=Nocardioides pinisoli TaxID=2950279 RepID=A0ABT1KXZ4_9ACTN|nr:MBL fold metallo-hydrolase [Nocardioides pinisoli]MCP3422229.1 MBL fold metallo-hydrolase [Nocardioides pinisoli]